MAWTRQRWETEQTVAVVESGRLWNRSVVEGFAIQVGSIWVAIPILAAVLFGLWKLVKIVWAAFSN